MSMTTTMEYDAESTAAPIAGATNVIQRRVCRDTLGRKKSRTAVAAKAAQSSLNKAILRYQRIGSYETFLYTYPGPGSLDIGHNNFSFPMSLGTVNVKNMPVHLFDLTSDIGAKFDSTTDTSESNCQYRLQRIESSPAGSGLRVGDFVWSFTDFTRQKGQDNVNAAVNEHWNLERCSNPSTYYGNQRYQHNGRTNLDWVDIKLCMHGAIQQTTRFTVQLVQLTDRAYDPEKGPYATTNSTPYGSVNCRSESEQNNMNAAFLEMCQPLVFHPMHSAGSTRVNVFKTLFRKSFVVNPDSDTNEDQAQPNIIYKLFKWMNRRQDYFWDDTPISWSDSALDSANYQQYFPGQRKDYLHPKARVFLLVSAQAYTSQDTPNVSKCPMLDVVIRKQITFDTANVMPV